MGIFGRFASPIRRRLFEAVLLNPYVAAKVVPLHLSRHGDRITRRVDPEAVATDGLAVPPQSMWEGWGPTAADYLRDGATDVTAIMTVLRKAGVEPEAMKRVLDFGCAAGRMLRFWPGEAERWGVDINAESIAWCQAHLSPPMRFLTTTTFPHLPFEDHTFDVIYSSSVFTHIRDLADAWLLELRRVIRPGGILYVTIHDKSTVQIALSESHDTEDHRPFRTQLHAFQKRTGALYEDWLGFSIGAEPHTQVFYDAEALATRWSAFLDVISVTPAAFDYQTALVLQKRNRVNG